MELIFMNKILMADHQIHTVVHRLLMYATVCRQYDNTDKNTASFMTCDFNGVLKGW